jgi:cytochrome c
MPVEDHPIYPRWRAAIERVIETKERRNGCRQSTPANTAADDEYQQALIAYDMIARQV